MSFDNKVAVVLGRHEETLEGSLDAMTHKRANRLHLHLVVTYGLTLRGHCANRIRYRVKLLRVGVTLASSLIDSSTSKF